MRRSAPRWRSTGRIAAVVVGGLLLACKPAAPASAPGAGPRLDDIADIEAALEQNADELEVEGIYVARGRATEIGASPQPVRQQAPRAEGEPTAAPELEAEEDAENKSVEAGASSDRVKPPAKNREDFWSRWLDKRGRKKNEADRCQRVCDLAEATCELADRICELAHRHPDEVRYEEVCRRAEHQCRVAAEACTACAG